MHLFEQLICSPGGWKPSQKLFFVCKQRWGAKSAHRICWSRNCIDLDALAVHASTSVKPHASIPDYLQTNSQVLSQSLESCWTRHQCSSVTHCNGWQLPISNPQEERHKRRKVQSHAGHSVPSGLSCDSDPHSWGSTASRALQHHRHHGWGFFTYSCPMLPLLVLKTFSLRHFAQPVSTGMSSVCGWWGQHHAGNCTGSSTHSQRRHGQEWGSGWGAPEPLCTTLCFQRFAASVGNLTPDQSTAQRYSLCWFSLCCCRSQVRIKLLARDCERQSTRQLALKIIGPWKLKFDKLLIHAI